MAITTLDGALAGMQPTIPFVKGATPTLVAGRPHSTWYLAGFPGAGTSDTSTATGVALSSSSTPVAGQIPHTDPGAGNSYLGRFSAQSSQAGLLMLCDRLVECGANSAGGALSPTATTAQTVNTLTLPSRDASGGTTGIGVQAAIEVSSILGAGTPTITLSYTNTGGSAGRTGTNVDSIIAASAAGAFYRIGLASGDLGVKSVQTITMNATQTSGQWVLVLYRVLAMLEIANAQTPNAIDALTSGFPQLYNGIVPFMVFLPNTTTASIISGTYTETQG